MRKPGSRERMDLMRLALVNRGYQEAITYSFVSHDLQSRLFPEQAGITLLNAISADMERMRVSLWPGLLTALRHNLNRRQERVRLFESGKVFSSNGDIRQSPAIGGLSYGAAEPEQWDRRSATGDFYDIKSDVEAVLSTCCGPVAPEYRPVGVPALHHGKAAELFVMIAASASSVRFTRRYRRNWRLRPRSACLSCTLTECRKGTVPGMKRFPGFLS